MLEQDEQSDATRILEEAIPDQQDAWLYQQLVAQKHLIHDDVDELAILQKRKRAGINDSNTLDVIVLPTLNCNFRCVYCYEEHRASHMDPKTAEGLKKWLAKEIPRHKVVMLYWFGGEPLLEYNTVLSVSRHVKSVADSCGVLSVLHITTNGYLLDAARSKELTAVGLRDFQITVDGPAAKHDALRVLHSGSGTFRRVFENVCTLANTDKAVKVTLRVNFNHTNLDAIPELLNAFPANIRPQLRVAFEPIFGDAEQSAVCNIPGITLSEKLAELSETAAALGYDVVFGLSAVHPGKLVYCYAERQGQYIVSYDGNVFKCSVCNFIVDDRVGNLDQDGTMHKDEAKWEEWVGGDPFSPKCYDCAYLPLCMGGCRKTRMETDSSKDCALVATNASYLLKHIAFGNLGKVFNCMSRCKPNRKGEHLESHCETRLGEGCTATNQEEC